MDECFQKGERCGMHGSFWPCTTKLVLQDVLLERGYQHQTWGDNRDLEGGTGPQCTWLLPIDSNPASIVEEAFREEYQEYEREHGKPTWVHLVREEIAEAFKENDQQFLQDELIQVAALCVSWVEKIRESRQWGAVLEDGSRITDNDWHCPADVMRSAHGFDLKQIRIITRYPGEEWSEY